jgi:hypothetical protein
MIVPVRPGNAGRPNPLSCPPNPPRIAKHFLLKSGQQAIKLAILYIANSRREDHSDVQGKVDPTRDSRQVYPFGPFRPGHKGYQVREEYSNRTTSKLAHSSSVSSSTRLCLRDLIYSHHADIVYSNSWAEGKISVLRLTSNAGDFEVLDSVETGGKGLNHMTVLPDCSAIVGAHVCPYAFAKGAEADQIVWVR